MNFLCSVANILCEILEIGGYIIVLVHQVHSHVHSQVAANFDLEVLAIASQTPNPRRVMMSVPHV